MMRTELILKWVRIILVLFGATAFAERIHDRHDARTLEKLQADPLRTNAAHGIKTLGGHLVDAATNLKIKAGTVLSDRLKSDPLEMRGAAAGLHLTSSSGCTLAGWRAHYFLASLHVATVSVGPSETTFEFDESSILDKVQGVRQLNGTHSNEEVADIFCQMTMIFPNACSFWSPGALKTLCPGLLAGSAMHGLKKFGANTLNKTKNLLRKTFLVGDHE
eukprot:TRINITY_DN15989_c0_g1_i1.p1 TRINITY_DN15989_c0_g1~~TRINITY_DN15989_c0_g1_i1.p1  ORF type:complete len:219 (+),score=36.48 TRINITY_DN15989_c0_g1_i1:95-751(+)